VGEDGIDDRGIIYAGDHSDRSGTAFANFNIKVEYPFEPPGPGHFLTLLFGGCFLIVMVDGFALAPPGRGDGHPVMAVGGEDAVETGEIDAGFGDEGSQSCHEIQWLEDHMRRSILVRCFQPVAHLSVVGEGETLL